MLPFTMDLAISLGLLWMMLLNVESEPELPHPELCIKDLCEYGVVGSSPIDIKMHCNAYYKEIGDIFTCLRSSKKNILSDVSLRFRYPYPTELEDNFFNGLDIISLRIEHLDVPELSNLTFSGMPSLKKLILSNGKLAKITHFPRFLKNLTELKIERQSFHTVPNSAFQELSYLKHLDLSNNGISRIGQYAFEGLDKLETLTLQNCYLNELPNFGNLSAIKELTLRDNKISEIQPDAFINLNSLNKLDLYLNQISLIHNESFTGLNELKELDLQSNNLTSLPNSAFRNMSKLEFLFLTDNNIKVCNSNDFLGLMSLQELRLNRNGITSVDKNAFAGLPKLTKLNLSSNNLTSVPSDALQNLTMLKRLYLENNKVTGLNKGDFGHLKSLQLIQLSNNKISAIHPDALKGIEGNLQYLALDQNSLTKIPVHALQNMRNLTYVSFGSFIEHVEADTFKSFGRTITAISLKGNRIKSFAESGFPHLPNLKDLYLENNQIHQLKFTVFQPVFNGLRRLMATGNPLECNCDLYWYYELGSKALSNTDLSNEHLEHNSNIKNKECKHNGTIIHLEQECKQEWKPIMCNATSLYGCFPGDFCKGEVGC